MEHSFIAWLKQRAAKLPQVPLGIGDDAAILPVTEAGLVVTTDSLCDGTHFILSECGPRAAGRKLAAVNLSDLAAMAAKPLALFISVCLPREGAGRIGSELFEGIWELANRYQVAIAGGDTNVWSGPLVGNITAIGMSPKLGCWKRSGAKPGDAIVVTGSLGGSLRGKHLSFEPRLALADKLYALGIVSAATDISDGLGIDLLNVFTASGCGAILELDRVPISDDAKCMADESGRSPLDHALSDGEDFELLLAVPKENLSKMPSGIDGIPLTVVGEFSSRTGLWARENHRLIQIPPKGYVHQ